MLSGEQLHSLAWFPRPVWPPSLCCPWTTPQAPGGLPRNHAHWGLLLKRLKEGTRWLSTLLPGICPNISRQVLASRRPGWGPSTPGKHDALALHL